LSRTLIVYHRPDPTFDRHTVSGLSGGTTKEFRSPRPSCAASSSARSFFGSSRTRTTAACHALRATSSVSHSRDRLIAGDVLVGLSRNDVLVTDDSAMAPLSEPERRHCWKICEDRYQLRSTILNFPNCRSRAGTNRSAILRWPTVFSTGWFIMHTVSRCVGIRCVRMARAVRNTIMPLHSATRLRAQRATGSSPVSPINPSPIPSWKVCGARPAGPELEPGGRRTTM
jgi:hypothetical protein